MEYKLRDVISYLGQIAPTAYQESYDNATLLTGNPDWPLTGVLCTLDCTEDVVEEAIQLGANLIVAHHPIIFKGLKSITGKNYVERTIIRALKHDIAIYAIHTNLDHVAQGVNKRIADRLGLENPKILQPKANTLSKLTFFVPEKNKNDVLDKLYATGAGQIGAYKNCSFQLKGMGTFTPTATSQPYSGEIGVPSYESEVRIEVILPQHQQQSILAALKKAHPYEEVAYYLQSLNNENQEVGAGMIGELSQSMDEEEFLDFLKEKMNLHTLKHTSLTGRKIKKVALCGGAGIFLLPEAKRKMADIFITADVKYHEFFDAEGKLVICDIGHYESEIFTKDLLGDLLSQNFPNIALYLTKVVTNPTSYR